MTNNEDRQHVNNVIHLIDAITDQLDGFLKMEIALAAQMVISIMADGVPARKDWPDAILHLAKWLSSADRDPLSLTETAVQVAAMWDKFTAKYSDKH